jgi:hypothetical protein
MKKPLDWRNAAHWKQRSDNANRQFLLEKLAPVPGQWRQRVEKIYATKKAAHWSQADKWLIGLSDRFQSLRVPVNLSDSEIIELATKCAAECMDLAAAGTIGDLESYRGRLERYCGRYAIKPPERERISKTGSTTGIPDMPAIKRMTDSLWWRKQLRKSQARALEAEAIALGYVHRKGEIYASDATVERRKQQRARNLATLEGTDAVNVTTGEIYTLAELAALAVSNPRIRRGELMTRIAGFEAVAQGVGHCAVFVTVTAPSRYHARMVVNGGKTVIDNPKYQGATPRDAQRYLSAMWAKVRAAWNRAKAGIYGFRIAEPHHDGTPHWHLLFFMAAEVKQKAMEIFAKHAMAEDAAELGTPEARKARFYAKDIDPSKGTAAGYIAKYVSKNIDGYAVQGDIEGGAMDAVTGSQRVEAWASTWGIRQFQQVGGPPVGVWRELRRMQAKVEASETVEAARSAADAGNWRRYVEVQGGPVVKRDDLPLRTAYTRKGERWDVIAGEPMPAPATRYGEIAAGAVYGVRDCVKGSAFVSRVYRWEVRRGLGVRGSAGSAGPWTRVNNCTEGGKDAESGTTRGMGVDAQIRGQSGNGDAGGRDYQPPTTGFDSGTSGISRTDGALPEPAGFRH